jgi:hypothetical protein
MRGAPISVAVVVAIMVVAAACSAPSASQPWLTSPPSQATAPTPEPTPDPTATPEPTPVPTPTPDPETPLLAEFDPGKFTNPTVIDNVWMPFTPGAQWAIAGDTIEGGERIPHRITFTVTDLTKEIAGVRTVVTTIDDISDGQLVEKEIAFYAQDDEGTVWYFGEHPEEFEDGQFVEAPTWLAGFEDAKPGIKMVAEPELGMQTYYQGWGPAVEWSDFGRPDAIALEDCVKLGCYTDVLRVAESSDGEEGIFQLKSYARGVGEIRVGWRGDAETREELELVRFTMLDPVALAKIRVVALELEASAYARSPDLYGKTDPAT